MMSTMPLWKANIVKIWSDSQKVAERRLPFALFACGLLAYAAALAWHMLTSYDTVNFINANADDAYYYFQIAYNLAQGKFSTFDGGITQTNGYQPIWLLIITPFYWIFDKETALFGIKALEIALVAGGVVVIAAAARVARLAWPLLFAALPILCSNPYELLWGMETAAAMFMLALFILALCVYMRDPQRWKWHLAALAFALPWVRIEYIAISLAVTVALCAIEWSRLERRALRLSALANIRHTYIPLIGAVAGMPVYFAYNGAVFGGILPVSAATKLAWGQTKWAQGSGYNLIESFQGTLRTAVFDYELLIALEICAYLLLVWRLALRYKEPRDWLLVAFLVGVFGLAASHIAKFAQIVLTLHHTGSHVWYFVPAYLMTALIIPVRLYVAIYLIRRFVAPRWRTAANASSIAVVVIGAAVLLGRAGFAEPFKQVDYQSKTIRLDWDVNSYMGAQIINRALPEGSVIGSWDAGVIGYFSRFPVVNLDGLVSSYEFANIIRQRGLALRKNHSLYDPHVAEIVRRYGVTHFANNLRLNDQVNVIFEGVPFEAVGFGERQFRVWTYDSEPETRDKIDHSHQVWDNLKPHFDHLSDGVGVILAGRTAQAFIKDCLPGEPLVWTWSERKHERSVRLEINPYRSRANMCMDARVLPHNANQPARAKMTTLDAYSDDLTKRIEPIIRSDFDVHIGDGSLIYTKMQCAQEDVDATFFANIFPVDAGSLPARLRQRGYVTIDFNFDDYGAISADGRCWAEAELPRYPISEIHAGQYVAVEDGYHYVWEGTYTAGASGVDLDANFERLEGREPIIRSDFDVYIIGDRLIYAKSQCGEERVEAPFFASIFPAYADSLSDDSRQRGYDAIDFEFARYGAIAADGSCWAAVKLPNYPIAKIHAGQYVVIDDGYHYPWEATYRFNE